jgi:thioester reductase-like protein
MGNIVASKVRLINQFGATELGLQALLQPLKQRDPADWQYVHFHPNIGVEFRPVTADVHELHVVRDPGIEMSHQPTFTLFPDKQIYASRDLFVRHPKEEKAYLWKWKARADDIIVFLNGEKTNPITMEQHIVFHNSQIAAVLIVGAQRFQAALLIEPADSRKLSTTEKAGFIEHIWYTIEAANQDCPTHARISKSHILFTDPNRPMVRAGKGTVQRAGTLALYAHEIDKLYEEAETVLDVIPKHRELIADTGNTDKLTEFVKHAILSATGWPTLSVEDNLFNLGMDSLQAITSLRNLRRGLTLPGLAASTLYANASVVLLVNAILQLARKDKESETAKSEARVDMLNSLSVEYRAKIDRIKRATNRESTVKPPKEIIILTGSTGAIGSYLLNVLLRHPSVAHIFCLNRSENASDIQSEKNQSRGLSVSLDSNQVTFLQTDFSQELLGLDTSTYKELSKTVTSIIHNAWPVNFNLALQSFRPHLDGLVNLIAFSAQASLTPRFVFISSISSVLLYPAPIIPETPIEDPSAPGNNGYAQSKYVAEVLLDAVSKARLAVPISFVRVGQVAGAAMYPGLWNKSEWFPSLVISSLRIGALPENIGSGLGALIDWIPIDLLADVLAELAIEPTATTTLLGDNCPPTTVFHAVHPHPISWDDLRDVVASELALLSKRDISIIPFPEWIQRVRNDIEASVSSTKTPAENDDLSSLLASNPAALLNSSTFMKL